MTFTKFFNGPVWQALPTWQWEAIVAGLWLGTVALVGIYVKTDMGSDVTVRAVLGEALTFVALMYTFLHMQVSQRLEESAGEAAKVDPSAITVECYYKLSRYLVRKEVSWAGAFIALMAFTALGGVPLFGGYSSWRLWYRKQQRG